MMSVAKSSDPQLSGVKPRSSVSPRQKPQSTGVSKDGGKAQASGNEGPSFFVVSGKTGSRSPSSESTGSGNTDAGRNEYVASIYRRIRSYRKKLVCHFHLVYCCSSGLEEAMAFEGALEPLSRRPTASERDQNLSS